MTNTYFCFSDESGGYQQYMSSRNSEKIPFYVRTSLIINSKDWKDLNHKFLCLKQDYDIPYNRELKWSDIFSVKKNSKKTPEHLKSYDYNTLLGFVDKSLGLLNELEEREIILTFSPNNQGLNWRESTLIKNHIKCHLQRIEKTFKHPPFNKICVLFVDPISSNLTKGIDKTVGEFYNELFLNGDDFMNYNNIIDCINFQPSHQSCGIQLSDYISGVFLSFLRYNTQEPNNYKEGVGLFYKHIREKIRKSSHNNIFGWGVIDVPHNEKNRMYIKEKFSDLDLESIIGDINPSIVF